MDSYYAELVACKHPSNTYYIRRFDSPELIHQDHPRTKNHNNDCRWFAPSWWAKIFKKWMVE